jgi:predicted N-formylglutamate amidohydrolase
MFRPVADGQPVLLNQPANLTAAEVQLRVSSLYVPYHSALKLVYETVKPTIILAPHSFTPVYEGQKRTVEIGVLYNQEKDRQLAEKFQSAFRALGIVTELNLPWSAKDGFMFAADQFSGPNTQVIMFEFRQDLVTDKLWRDKVRTQTIQVLNQLGHR